MDMASERCVPNFPGFFRGGNERLLGDKVVISECLGYWSWASPFEVLAIEGEMAELELVDELVGIERLSKV